MTLQKEKEQFLKSLGVRQINNGLKINNKAPPPQEPNDLNQASQNN